MNAIYIGNRWLSGSVVAATLWVTGCSRCAEQEAAIARADAARASLESDRAKIDADLQEAVAKLAAAEGATSKARAELETMRLVQAAVGLKGLEVPNPDWTAERVLEAYFRAPPLAHRLVLVKDVETIAPLMAAYHRDYRFGPISVAAMQVPKADVPIGGTLSVAVKLSGAPLTEYVLVRTSDGFRIDWLASKKNWEAAEAAVHREKTPRENLLDVAIRQEWVQPWYSEISLGGKTMRVNDLDVHADRIVRTGDRLELFITVKNIGMGHVFSPATHPYNDAMRFQGKFVDTFANWTLLTLERGTHDMKPGESAVIQYSVELKIDAPLYLLTFGLDTSNALLNSKSFYLIVSDDDFAAGD